MPKQDIVVIGTSAGGVEALQVLASGLPRDLPAAVFVVLHIGRGLNGHSHMPEILTNSGPLSAAHPQGLETITHGRIYVAKPDCHMVLEDGHVRSVFGPKENRTRPAINPLFRSAAAAYGSLVTGVILTGLQDDGVAGLAEIKRQGGVAIVQDPATALFPSMPENALRQVDADHIAPLPEIAGIIAKLAVAERMASFRQESMQKTLLDIQCPECTGPLWEERQGKIVEYRCRVGHAFSPLSLKEEYEEQIEKSLWSSIIALENAAEALERVEPELDLNALEGAKARREQATALRELLRRKSEQ